MLVARKGTGLSAQDCFIEELSTIAELEAYVEEWDKLAAACQEPNVFYESWMMLPAIRHLCHNNEQEVLRVYLVWNRSAGEKELIGFFPFTEFSHYHGVPLRHLRSFNYCHCYLSTPLIRAGHESRCWRLFLEWTKANTKFKFCRLSCVGGEGAVYNEGIKAAKLASQHVVETDRHIRACMQPAASFEEYLRINVSRKVRKDIRRKFKRLSEQGKVSFELLQTDSIVSDWIFDFMELEAKGWKGRNQVAIVNDVSHLQFLREVCTLARQKGKLHMAKLSLNGIPIAMKLGFRSGGTLFAFKIAFDEKYATSSPGLLLEYDHLQALCSQNEIQWVDSCMKPGDFMISRLWKDSRMIRFVNISSAGTVSKTLVSLVPLVKRIRDGLPLKLK